MLCNQGLASLIIFYLYWCNPVNIFSDDPGKTGAEAKEMAGESKGKKKKKVKKLLFTTSMARTK